MNLSSEWFTYFGFADSRMFSQSPKFAELLSHDEHRGKPIGYNVRANGELNIVFEGAILSFELTRKGEPVCFRAASLHSLVPTP